MDKSKFVYTPFYGDTGFNPIPLRIGFSFKKSVVTLKNYDQILSALRSSERASLDVETTSLYFDNTTLVSVNLSYMIGTEIMSHTMFFDREYCQVFGDMCKELPSRYKQLCLIKEALSRKYCCMHNRYFDQRVLMLSVPYDDIGDCVSMDQDILGLGDKGNIRLVESDFHTTYDTLDLVWGLDTNVRFGLGLKELGRMFLGIDTMHYTDAVGEDILKSHPKQLLEYGALDTYMTLALFNLVYPIYMQRYSFLFNLHIRFKNALFTLEEEGQCIDIDKARRIKESIESQIKEVETEFYRDYGEINLSSSLAKSRLLTSLGYFTGSWCKPRKDGEKVMSVSQSTLDSLAKRGCVPAALMAKYSKLMKMLTAYVNPLLSHCESVDRVRFHYFDSRVPTMRLASGAYTILKKKYPYFLPVNVQSLPKPKSILRGLDFDSNTMSITFRDSPLEGKYCVETGEPKLNFRSLILAGEGRTLVKADYSAEELRLATIYSNEPVWVEAFSSGVDPHTSTAKRIWNLDHVDGNSRKKAKIANFGLLFMGSYKTLMDKLGMEETEAIEFEKMYRQTLSTLYAWKERVYHEARVTGSVRNIFGQERRILPFLRAGRSYVDYGYRTALSSMIQGAGGIIIRIALVKLWNLIYSDNKIFKDGEVRFVETVHDEVVFSVVDSKAAEFAKLLEETLVSCTPPKACIPLEAEVEVGKNYGEMFAVKVVTDSNGKITLIPKEEERPVEKREREVESKEDISDSLPDIQGDSDSDSYREELDGFSY